MRLIPITLLFFILSGCLHREATHSFKQEQLPKVVGTAPPPETTEKNQTVHLIDDGGESCEKYLLKKIAGEMVEGNQVVKLKTFTADNKTRSFDLKKWLANMDEEKLAAYEVRYDDKRALLLGSLNVGATGIASNFQNWYLQLGNYSIKFLSLSENPKLLFWDKDGLLNYYSVGYGDKFLENRDWDNLTLNLIRYSVSSNGGSQIVSEERNMKCQ
jgi:hypothetical protein